MTTVCDDLRLWGRQPRVLSVVHDPTPEESRSVIDWSEWYLDWEDDVGQGTEHEQSIKVTRSCVEELFRTRSGSKVFIGHDQFYAWIESEPRVRVSPDLYLQDEAPARPWPDIWETWRAGVLPPRWALEVVSPKLRKKDYDLNPEKYAMLGARELVIFDPEVPAGGSRRGREKWSIQVYHRDEDGLFVRIYKGDGPVWSDELDACLVCDRSGPMPVLRVAHDHEGKKLVPTAEEAREAADRAREAADTAREAAEAESRALRAELSALRSQRGV